MSLLRDWTMLVRDEMEGYGPAVFRRDLLAALTVAAVALPLALAFGVASGADAAAGLVTAVLAGLIIGLFGGAPYQVSGPTGAMSAVLVVVSARHGLAAVWMVGLMAGILLVVLAVLRLGRVVSLIPAPVISGFTSGIALIIALGQLDNATGLTSPAGLSLAGRLAWYASNVQHANPRVATLVGLVVLCMIVWPRTRLGHHIPGPLVGIVAATSYAALAGWEVPVIGTIPRGILLEQRLRPSDLDWQAMAPLIVPAMSVAALGAIESLLCGAVAGNMTGIRLHGQVELFAQGLGNIVIPFFGGVPATAAIARTSVNVKSGGVTRLAPMLHGFALLLAALVLAPAIARVPLSALAGVLIVTAWRMNEWHAIRFYFGRRLEHAMLAFVITLVATVLLDLTQAILLGFGISTLVFMAQISELEITRQSVDPNRLPDASRDFVHPKYTIGIYFLGGPLFFSSARRLIEEIERQDGSDATLILSLRAVPLVDATGVEVLRELWHRQRRDGGNLLLTGLGTRLHAQLDRSGLLDEIGHERLFWSTDRAILSLHADLPGEPDLDAPGSDFQETLALTPHEDRVDSEW